MPSTPRSPMVLRQRVTLRILAAARIRSLLLMIFAAAAAISGMMRPLELAELRFGGGVVEEIFAEFADGHALERREGFAVVGVEDAGG